MSEMTPREIVQELDKHIIGQDAAKRAVAIALRNRWRRMQIHEELRNEITPKNILMIGPTGVGKTEIARRLAHLADDERYVRRAIQGFVLGQRLLHADADQLCVLAQVTLREYGRAQRFELVAFERPDLRLVEVQLLGDFIDRNLLLAARRCEPLAGDRVDARFELDYRGLSYREALQYLLDLESGPVRPHPESTP